MRATARFEVNARREGETLVVAPTGELDLATVGTLRRAVREDRGYTVLVLDLRGLAFMDSAGLGLVVEECRRAAEDGFDLRVVRTGGMVQRLLEMTGLARRLQFVEPEPKPAAPVSESAAPVEPDSAPAAPDSPPVAPERAPGAPESGPAADGSNPPG